MFMQEPGFMLNAIPSRTCPDILKSRFDRNDAMLELLVVFSAIMVGTTLFCFQLQVADSFLSAPEKNQRRLRNLSFICGICFLPCRECGLNRSIRLVSFLNNECWVARATRFLCLRIHPRAYPGTDQFTFDRMLQKLP